MGLKRSFREEGKREKEGKWDGESEREIGG